MTAIELVTDDGELRAHRPRGTTRAVLGAARRRRQLRHRHRDRVRALPPARGLRRLADLGLERAERAHGLGEWTQTAPDDVTTSAASCSSRRSRRSRSRCAAARSWSSTPPTRATRRRHRAAAPAARARARDRHVRDGARAGAHPPAPGPGGPRARHRRRRPDRGAAGRGVDALVAVAGPGSGSPLLLVELRQLGGALSRPRRAPGRGARDARGRVRAVRARHRHDARDGRGASRPTWRS